MDTKNINQGLHEIYVDGILLDLEDKDFFLAVEHIKYVKSNITYITGKAGTGKTTLLKYISQEFENTIVLAPTGIAAINAKGKTIHSFFELEPSIYLPQDERLQKIRYKETKINIIKLMKYLIIDEVSMLRSDILDAIDYILRRYRKNKQPFGGVKVILFGDLFQLPAILPQQENMRTIFFKEYDSQFFFDSKVYKNSTTNYIELSKIHRQTEEELISFLNSVRIGCVKDKEIEWFNNKCIGEPLPNSIMLGTTNKIVNDENITRFDKIESEEIIFNASINGVFPKEIYPVDCELHLKIGCQIMLVANKYNEDGTFSYCNGDIGTIEFIKEDTVFVKIKDELKTVNRHLWENIDYNFNEDSQKIESKVVGTYTQFPIKLAWAITVHKSQGLTFDNVYIDPKDVFTDGQTYVALSRCRKLNGIRLKQGISISSIRVNSKVVEFSKQKNQNTFIIEAINTGKADYIYKECRDAVDNNDVVQLIDKYKSVIKLRDDLGTPLFNKYLRVKIKQINHLKHYSKVICDLEQKKQTLLYESIEKNKIISDLRLNIDCQNSNINQLKLNSKKQTLCLEKQDSEIKKLKEKARRLELENSQLTSKIKKMETNMSEYKKQIEIMHEMEKVRDQEISRLQKTSWLQKLFGRK